MRLLLALLVLACGTASAEQACDPDQHIFLGEPRDKPTFVGPLVELGIPRLLFPG